MIPDFEPDPTGADLTTIRRLVDRALELVDRLDLIDAGIHLDQARLSLRGSDPMLRYVSQA